MSQLVKKVSKADIRSGVGEIMKAALVHDGRLFTAMQVLVEVYCGTRRPHSSLLPPSPPLPRHSRLLLLLVCVCVFVCHQQYGKELIESNFAPSVESETVIKFSVDTMLEVSPLFSPFSK